MVLLIELTFWALAGAVGLFVLYLIIRAAVRDGMVAAHVQLDRDRVRGDLGVGRERSPNTRRTHR